MKTKAEIFNYIDEKYPDSSVVVFDDCMGEGYYSAFIGITDMGRAVYDYDLMIEELMDKYMANPDQMVTDDKPYTEEDAYTDAVDWISFNTFRAMPYEGSRSPIVVSLAPEYEQYVVMCGLYDREEDEVTFTDLAGNEHVAISEERFCQE